VDIKAQECSRIFIEQLSQWTLKFMATGDAILDGVDFDTEGGEPRYVALTTGLSGTLGSTEEAGKS